MVQYVLCSISASSVPAPLVHEAMRIHPYQDCCLLEAFGEDEGGLMPWNLPTKDACVGQEETDDVHCFQGLVWCI